MCVHISLATDNIDAFEAVAHALRTARHLDASTPPVLIDGSTVHRENFSDIGPIMVEAKRRADAVRTLRRATIGVGVAHGRTALMCAGGAARARFTFIAVVSTVKDGALAYALPNIYPGRIVPDLKKRVTAIFDKIRSYADHDDLIVLAGVSAGAWAGLNFGDPGIDYEEFA